MFAHVAKSEYARESAVDDDVDDDVDNATRVLYYKLNYSIKLNKISLLLGVLHSVGLAGVGAVSIVSNGSWMMDDGWWMMDDG